LRPSKPAEQLPKPELLTKVDEVDPSRSVPVLNDGLGDDLGASSDNSATTITAAALRLALVAVRQHAVHDGGGATALPISWPDGRAVLLLRRARLLQK